MATRFELVLYGSDPVRLRAAGEEALGEIERLDARLSLYRADSELSWVNRQAADEAVKVDPRFLKLLQRCADITAHTDGTFDITVAPLMRTWNFVGDTGRKPDSKALEAALEITGMQHVLLDEEHFTVRFDRKGVEMDLGAVGKGYAIERAIGLLRENGITSALLHGGTSTVYAIGMRPDGTPWKVAIRDPLRPDEHAKVVDLHDNALSVSAVHGKSFTENGREFGHVIDPRTGQPVQEILTAAVIGPSATECDALSTALLVLGEPGLSMLAERFSGYSGVVVPQEATHG